MTQQRANRLNFIIDCLSRAGEAGSTRKELAECMEIKVSPYLNQLLDTLVADGHVRAEMDQQAYPPRWRYFTQGASEA